MHEGTLPRRGRGRPGAAAVKQDGANLALAFPYGMGHSRLRHAQDVRGPREAASLVYGEQEPEFLRTQHLRAAF